MQFCLERSGRSRVVKVMSSLQTVASIEVGATVETGSLRIHRYRDHLVLWDITNAGKRGKKVPRVSVSPAFSRGLAGAEGEALLDRVGKLLTSYECFERAVATLKALNQDAECLRFDYQEERGVDVKPTHFPTIEIRTAKLRITADFRTFSIEDLTDKFNEPTAIPDGDGQKAVAKFYLWVRDNRATVESFTFREILNSMRQLGIRCHSYCAVD